MNVSFERRLRGSSTDLQLEIGHTVGGETPGLKARKARKGKVAPGKVQPNVVLRPVGVGRAIASKQV